MSVGESIIQLALRKVELNTDVLLIFMIGFAMSFPPPATLNRLIFSRNHTRSGLSSSSSSIFNVLLPTSPLTRCVAAVFTPQYTPSVIAC